MYNIHEGHELEHMGEGIGGLIWTLVNRHEIPLELVMKNLTLLRSFFLAGDCRIQDLEYDPETKRIRMRNFYWKTHMPKSLRS